MDVHLYKTFAARRYLALTALQQVSNFVLLVQKQLGMNTFVRTKSHTGSKFSKIFLEHLYTEGIVVVQLYYDFSLWCQVAPQQSAKFITTFFGQFRTSFRKDSVAKYTSTWTLFSLLYRGPDVLCITLNMLQFYR